VAVGRSPCLRASLASSTGILHECRLPESRSSTRFYDPLMDEMVDPPMRVVMLAMTNQNILWHTKQAAPGSKEPPLCKSPDGIWGFPTPSALLPQNKEFPWDRSGFREEDFPPEANGMPKLPCASCALINSWTSHPNGDKPYCSATYAFPVLYHPGGDERIWAPALISVARTGLKPADRYMTRFSVREQAMFTVLTDIGLDVRSMGTNVYCVPNFTQREPTNQMDWEGWAQQAIATLALIRRHPVSGDDNQESDIIEEKDAAVPQAQPTPPPPPAPAATAATAAASPAVAPSPAATQQQVAPPPVTTAPPAPQAQPVQAAPALPAPPWQQAPPQPQVPATAVPPMPAPTPPPVQEEQAPPPLNQGLPF
jgi:hypothetical protein